MARIIEKDSKYYTGYMIKWTDYNLTKHLDRINILFSPKIDKKDLKVLKNDYGIRYGIAKLVLRLLLLCGFVVDDLSDVKQVKSIHRVVLGQTIGFYSLESNLIQNILSFLNVIDMEYLSVLFSLALCKAMKEDKSFYSKVKKDNTLKTLLSIQKNNICAITGLNYEGNSCYMDSTLICLFGIPNKTITNEILNKDLKKFKKVDKIWSKCNDNIDSDIKRKKDIQIELLKITRSMRREGKHVENCHRLRKTLMNCPGTQLFHTTETQDAGEFLSYIFNIFQVNVATQKISTYGSNVGSKKWTLVTKKTDMNASPIVDITSTMLLNAPNNYKITKHIKTTEFTELSEDNRWYPDKSISYIKKKQVIKIKSPLIIFNISRTYGQALFNKPQTKEEKSKGRGSFIGIKTQNIWKKISAPETMNMKEKTLYLTGIVVHTGGAHYVANFKCNGNWYWYDDNPGSFKHEIKYVGSYQHMLKTTPNPMTHGTLYFYT